MIEGEKVDIDHPLGPGAEVFLVHRVKNAFSNDNAKREILKFTLANVLLKDNPDPLYRLAATLFEPEEIRRIKASGGKGYSTVQVLEHLRSLRMS